jgi:hypothetical protein
MKQGEYEVCIRYACRGNNQGYGRRTDLYLNGQLVISDATPKSTGSTTDAFLERNQQWFDAGPVGIPNGTNVLKLQAAGSFPHVSLLKIVYLGPLK